MHRACITLVSIALLLSTTALQAVILYSGDNSANQTAPDTARTDVFHAVARVCDNGGGNTRGSAVHIRGKYLLTANHVSLRSHVTFDGVTYWARDTSFTPITFASIDMKLFKLVDDPGLPGVQLYTGTQETPYRSRGSWQYTTATLVGWGRGRDPADASGPTWDWGNGTTHAKRWGENRIEASLSLSYPLGNLSYNYTALRTQLDDNAGNDEAASALYDSGSGIFVEDQGIWKLAGLTTAVQTSGSSTFASPGDQNYFVRITSYAADIEAAIPDTTTYAGWKLDHSLSGAPDDSDDDADGIELLLEFALGGDPTENDLSILPVQAFTEDSGSTYLELSLTRPDDLQGIIYTPQTTTDLSAWPTDSTGIADPSPTAVDNGDGTETLSYRRAQAVSGADKAFIRVDVSESTP
ncbi:MAG: hypothetical protein ACPGIC_06850 [Opitutales bacterium]